MKPGVILAAGIGSRLQKIGVKPLVTVGRMELLLRTIHSHEIAGCTKIIIVLGWHAHEIKNRILSCYNGKTPLQFVENDKYHLNNGISVLCARPYVKNSFLLTMADHVLDDGIMELAGGYRPPENGATLCVDYKLDQIFDIDDATKVFAVGKGIKRIGKNLDHFNCIDTGVFIGTNGLMDVLEEVYRQQGDASLSEGVQMLADKSRMTILDIGEYFWQDVDTPEMLNHAEKLLSHKQEF